MLWIGYLQWHFRTRGAGLPPSPILKDFHNIECRDAVLAYDSVEFVLDERGVPVTHWDGRTFKKHPVTGEDVPDETAQVPLERYKNPRAAEWPEADVVVGNPPFIGASTMRAALGDGYVDALRGAWQKVPDSADFVMFWWHHAAELVAQGKLSRFGFITTNSLRQTFNRRVVQGALDTGLHLDFAIPDHPWVDSADGAAVRIAMTVVAFGAGEGRRVDVVAEREGMGEGVDVELAERRGILHADLATGANVAAAQALLANERLANRGFQLFGAGFIVTPDEAATLEADAPIKPYRNGRDLTDRPRGVSVIDLYGFDSDEVRRRWPAINQWVLEHVKPERDHNNRASYRDNWWVFGEPRKVMRATLAGLPRYIATVETAKHRVFQFLDASIAPDIKLVCVALDDGYSLGVLSSQVHVAWALASGTLLEDRPVYNKGFCFETFPLPAATPRQQSRIYNVLEKLRAGSALNAKEKAIHDKGLVAVLRSLHIELDAAVLDAYGWADHPSDEQLLERLVALNAERAAEEAQGHIRWLRPEFQAPESVQTIMGGMADSAPRQGTHSSAPSLPSPPSVKALWPQTLPDQMAALAAVLSQTPQSLDELANHFSGKGKWKARLPELLATLATLGRARALEDGRWMG